MNLRCKPGQMAKIIRDDDWPANVGNVVTVVKVAPCLVHGLVAHDIKLAWPMWMWNFDTEQMVLVTPSDLEHLWCRHPDAWLEPIEPPATPAVEETEEALTA